MAFCMNCGQKLPDEAKFCFICGVSTEDVNAQSLERRITYDGEIHKCPQCGEVLKSFAVNCSTCGYEIRGAKNSTSIREFADKLEEIEKARTIETSGFKKRIENKAEKKETDLKKVSFIRSYAIPNTKEDLLEFIVLAASNVNLQRYADPESMSESEQAVSDAWEAKLEQAYEKAKLSFGNAPEFKKIQDIYENKKIEIKDSKKKNVYTWIRITFAFLVILGFVFFMLSSESRQITAENERLEVIVEEVYDALEEDNFVLARAKAASLVFSGPDNSDAELASEKWDKTRRELLAIIDAAANEESNKTIKQDDSSNYNSNQKESADE